MLLIHIETIDKIWVLCTIVTQCWNELFLHLVCFKSHSCKEQCIHNPEFRILGILNFFSTQIKAYM